MTPLESLELPEQVIKALLKAGLRNVEDLCALTVREVAAIDGITPKIQGVTDIRAAMAKLGLDVRQFHEDPVGWPDFPSRKALRGLFDDLDLMPATRKAFTVYLLKAIVREELMSQIDPEDNGKIIRLLDLIDECHGH
jgi:hypothetical protein